MRMGSLCKNLLVALLMVPVVPALSLAQGEEQAPKYTPEEYDAFQRAVNEPDAAKKEDAIINFIKANPQSALNEWTVGSYLQLMQQYQTEGKHQKVTTAGEKFLALRPDNISAVYLVTASYYQIQQFAKVAEKGEKLFALKGKSDSNMDWVWPRAAFFVADSYVRLGNDDKVVEYGEQACQNFEPKDCHAILAELTRIYAAQQQWNKAAEYAKKTIEGFEAVEKANPNLDAQWKNYASTKKALSHAVLGRQAAERQNWSGALSNYQACLRTNSSMPALNGEAYYYIGLGHWKQGRMDAAMEAFARGYKQPNAPHSKHCRQYLETLYKVGHNDSLAGIEEFIQRVTGR